MIGATAAGPKEPSTATWIAGKSLTATVVQPAVSCSYAARAPMRSSTPICAATVVCNRMKRTRAQCQSASCAGFEIDSIASTRTCR